MAVLFIEEEKKNKYHAIKAEVDGIKFHSTREARHYAELSVRQRHGEIKNLRCQVAFRLEFNGVFIGRYYADFVYEEKGKLIVADSKGSRTPVYQLKKKMMLALHGINILEL